MTAATEPAPPARRAVVVMPAYNAARTLERIVARVPPDVCDEIIVVDDGSQDDTVKIARRLPVTLICHDANKGYGGNQKTCYRAALERGATEVVMLHPDEQYDVRLISPALEIVRAGVCDVVLGNRIRTRREALDGGMPWYKYLANRGLSLIENMLAGQNLGEWHSGFRVYTRAALETIPFDRNSDDFVFDSQLLVQAVHLRLKVGDLPVPVIYHERASSISLWRSTQYAVATGWVFVRWILHRARLVPCRLFRVD